MVTEPVGVRRLAVVLARHSAAAAAPPGVDPAALGPAALADTYEVLADLVGVSSGVAGPPELAELLWPGSVALPDLGPLALAELVSGQWDELVVVPGDVPDLPGLVLAKVFKVLHRTDLVVAPERGGGGCVAVGIRLPVADWLQGQDVDLDADPYQRLLAAAPSRACCARAPDWHRLRGPAGLRRLDPGLEGWEETRALLGGAGATGRGAR